MRVSSLKISSLLVNSDWKWIVPPFRFGLRFRVNLIILTIVENNLFLKFDLWMQSIILHSDYKNKKNDKFDHKYYCTFNDIQPLN